MSAGLYNTAFAAGLAAGPMVFGLYIGTFGLVTVSLIYSAVMVASAVAALVLVVEPKRAGQSVL